MPVHTMGHMGRRPVVRVGVGVRVRVVIRVRVRLKVKVRLRLRVGVGSGSASGSGLVVGRASGRTPVHITGHTGWRPVGLRSGLGSG